MNRKGFTLIELVVTIALLAIVATISFVSINSVLEHNKVKSCNSLVNSIKSAATEYVSDNRYGTINTNITAKYLVDNKYLNVVKTDGSGLKVIDNPFNNSYIYPNDIAIRIVLKSDNSVNYIDLFNKSGNIIHCNSNMF